MTPSSLMTAIPKKKPYPQKVNAPKTAYAEIYKKLFKEVSISKNQKIHIMITIGYRIWRMRFDRKRPRKYADGEYILFASSLFITGACSGTCIIVAMLDWKDIWFASMNANPLMFMMKLFRAFTTPSSPLSIRTYYKSGKSPSFHHMESIKNEMKKD